MDLTLRQKIGQLLMVGFQGKTPQDAGVQAVLKQIQAGKIGGVILFAYNIENPPQLKTLTTVLQQAAPAGYPLLIAVDQEGGKVQRLSSKNGFKDFKSAKEAGQTMTPLQATAYYENLAQMLSYSGINLNFAPVVDLHSSPEASFEEPGTCPVIGQLTRSYSNDPQRVAQYGEAFIKAHHKHGILTCLKHWPGHGLATKDTHKGYVDITTTHLEAELIPFQILLQDHMTDMIMSAHLTHKKYDPQHPCTLSEHMIEPLLRQKQGYKGVVITDDLMMGAIQNQYTYKEVVIRALKAGNDILLISGNAAAYPKDTGTYPKTNADLVDQALANIENAVKNKELSLERIEVSYRRIKDLKEKLSRPSPASKAAF